MTFSNNINRIMKCIFSKRVTWYFLGLITLPVVFFALSLAGVNPPASEAELLVSRWGLVEQEKGKSLYVHLPFQDKTFFMTGFRRDPQTGFVDEIGVTNYTLVAGKTNQFGDELELFDGNMDLSPYPCYVFRAKGRYGVPMAVYGSPNNIVWQDLNADGLFDMKIDHGNRCKEIRLDSAWIEAIGKGRMLTRHGTYMFEPDIGKWVVVEANQPAE